MRSVLKPLVPLLLLVAVLCNTTAMLTVKIAVDFLSMGFSSGKTILLLAFLTAIFLGERFPSPWKSKWNPVLLVGIVTLHLMALAERVIFVRGAGVGMDAWQAIAQDGHYTTSRLGHMHEPKAVLAWMSGYRGDAFDSGAPFLSWFPTWLLALHALLLLSVVLMAYLAAHHFAKTESTEKTLTLALALFAVIKAAVDGGPFSPEVAIPVPFLVGLLFGRDKARFGYAFLALYLPFTLWCTGSGQLKYNLLKALGAYLLLEAPLLWEHGRSTGKRVWYLVIGLYVAVMASVPWMQFKVARFAQHPPFTLGTLLYGRSPLVPGQEVTIFSDHDLAPLKGDAFDLLSVWKGQAYSAYRAKILRATTPSALCDQLSLNLSWQPITWYDKITYVQLYGHFPVPPAGWPSSDMVTEWALEERGSQTRIVLALRGGGKLNMAINALPPGASVVTSYDIGELRPQAAAWKVGPGAPPSLPAVPSASSSPASPPKRSGQRK